jgi:serine/threonine protein kinase
MTDNLIGARLANYEIESALGQGGMARVYKAVDITLKRPVAIKVIEPNLSAQEKYRERFEREAQSVASLEHPHIVPVYYFGKTRNLYYLAMKFIEGEDLGSLMNRYANAGEYLPLNDILRIVESVGSALDYAHGKGVIHRDVKPANVMVDVEGYPYLTDFGLALNLSQGTIGDVLGTPHYVSPEQARNSADAVPQSDIYSLGVMLYELFTGVVPFDDPSPAAVALQHLMNEPPAPRALNPDISPELEGVILKAMAKKPEDRYQSGKELFMALRTALQDAEASRNVQELPALPPLPAGFQPPPLRHPSTRSVAAEVKASLAQRATLNASPMPTTAAGKATAAHQSPSTLKRGTNEQRGTYTLPLLVLGGVIVAVIVIVAIVALALSNSATNVAALPTAASTPTTVPPTNTVIVQSASSPVVPVAVLPSATPAPPTPIPRSPVAPSVTPVPPSPVPPTATLIPPTATLPSPTPVLPTALPLPAGPTAAPADWLPVRFIYTADAFYWMNDSGTTISSKSFVFERIGGSQHFEGSRFAYYSLESGRCMEIVFADVARIGCPENRRPNAYFTPTRNQGVDFWTGGTGQFHVLWNGVEVAVCDIAAGQCSASLPPH